MLPCEPVNRFMTAAVLSIDVRCAAGEILRLLAAYPVHHLPVVDNTKVVGMLSSADVAKFERFIPKHCKDKADYLNRTMTVATIMRRPAITVLPHQSLEYAARLMATHGIHGLPVTDSNDNLLGIITTTDIIHAALHPERRGDLQDDSGSRAGPVRISDAELAQALHLAGPAAEAKDDGGTIARALLYLRSREKFLEDVLTCADRYLTAGQDESLHTKLTQAIERARAARGELKPTLGL
jgi:CBS domain-containing protein